MKKDTTAGMEKIASLFDSGTFVEVGAYLARGDGNKAGAVCGYGAVNGKLAYAFAQDSDRQKGAFDALQAKKIAALYGMAMKNGAPVIGVFDSAGSFVGDGASVLAAYGTFLRCVSDASGVIPQIAVIPGVCAGMAATAASMFDLTVTVKDKSEIFVNAPFVVGKETGTAAYAAQTGIASLSAENEAQAFALARELVDLLPANSRDGVAAENTADDVNRKLPASFASDRALIGLLSDGGKFTEIGAGFAPEMITGFCRLGGVVCGIVANDGDVKEGRISSDAAKKAAKMISFCDGFGIPVITLIDSQGVAVSADEEGTPLAAQLGKLAMAYASASTAKITVVTGKAYGAAFTLMGSAALGADQVLALPEAKISVMAPDAAVAFLWNGQISEKVSRADLEEKWTNENAASEKAAQDGAIDDIVDPAELRQRICAAVYMLMMKDPDASFRKHCNLPL